MFGLREELLTSFEEQAQNGLASAKPYPVSSIALRRAEAAFALTHQQNEFSQQLC